MGYWDSNYTRYILSHVLDSFVQGDRIKICCTIKDSLFKNQETGYAVYKVEPLNYSKWIHNSVEDDFSFSEPIMPNEEEKQSEIKLTGFVELLEKQTYKIIGEITQYKEEKQIKIVEFEYDEPKGENDIISFLSIGIIKGIGEKTAEKIVKGYKDAKGNFIKGFGEETLNVIRDTPHLLTRITGITEKKAEKIHLSYMESIEYQNIIFFFKKYDITLNQIMRIYKRFKGESIKVVTENPFVLTQVKGIGFRTADEIAKKIGLDPHSIYRIKAGIFHVLKESENEGHCFLLEETLIKKVSDILMLSIKLLMAKDLVNLNPENDIISYRMNNYFVFKLNKKELVDAIKNSKNPNKEKIVLDKISDIEIKNILETMLFDEQLILVSTNGKRCIYTKELYNAEITTAMYINNITRTKPDIEVKEEKIEKYISDFENMKGFNLEKEQKLAIKESMKYQLLLILGEAGTGKTTVSEGIIYVYQKLYPEHYSSIICTAPTGRASKRISEVTKLEAKTMHRLLENNGEAFVKNDSDKLEQKLIVVDEMSMVDIRLAKAFFSAVDASQTKVIIMGDYEQLPSVGAGNVLKDMYESQKIPTVKLNIVKRQLEGSNILNNAYRILGGESLESNKEKNDFLIIYEDVCNKVADKIIKSIERLLDTSKYNFSIDNIQVICPQKTSEIGTIELNRRIQQVVNPPSPSKNEFEYGMHFFRKGDKVMHITNDYKKEHYFYDENTLKYEKVVNETGVFNGDIGRIIDVINIEPNILGKDDSCDKEKVVIVAYDNVICMYGREELQDLVLSYAITIHKSQGSQFDVVLIPFHFSNYYKMLNKNLGYTAVTRAKQIVGVFGQKKAMDYMVSNSEAINRNTRLKYLIV